MTQTERYLVSLVVSAQRWWVWFASEISVAASAVSPRSVRLKHSSVTGLAPDAPS